RLGAADRPVEIHHPHHHGQRRPHRPLSGGGRLMADAPRTVPAAALPRRPDGGPPRLLFVVTEDWFFLSHRLPMARAARDAGFEIHAAPNVAAGADAIAREGFALHPIRFARGRLAPLETLATIRSLRRLHGALAPDLVHHVALQPTILGSLAALGLPVGRVNA